MAGPVAEPGSVPGNCVPALLERGPFDVPYGLPGPVVDDAHERGLQLFVYTVNDREEMEALQALGVDGLFTDYPDRAMSAIHARR